MDKLTEARAVIDQVDRQMAELFCQRMEAVKAVAEAKQELGLQIFDPKREGEVILKNSARVENPELKPYYVDYLKS
ncbi:MAG: chorismate mutase, partial [Clostridia bacterium]|nr:chorismate mutase [Clostridia bacterium]